MSAQPVLTPAGTPYVPIPVESIDFKHLLPSMGIEFRNMRKGCGEPDPWQALPHRENSPYDGTFGIMTGQSVEFRRVVNPGVMTRTEVNLLLFLETCVVDQAGLIRGPNMNADDITIAREWDEVGFIKFSRLKFKQIRDDRTHMVLLSEAAHWLAGHERHRRAIRNCGKVREYFAERDGESDSDEE